MNELNSKVGRQHVKRAPDDQSPVNKPKTPKWTVLETTISADGYASRNRQFFDNEYMADEAFIDACKNDGIPTKRPWSEMADRQFLEYHTSEL